MNKDSVGHVGSKEEFNKNWKEREETNYNHWVRDEPRNQIQLAFRSHWEVFQDIMGPAVSKGRSLEVGCGRGSLSSYFADSGWDATLLDFSESVLKTAEKVFKSNNHPAVFIPGDANDLPFPDNSFDVTSSIGLLEHFEDVRTPISEQLRVLKPGGWFLGYIVPERPDNVQKYFNWINKLLAMFVKFGSKNDDQQAAKTEVFRSDNYSNYYIKAMEGLEYENLTVFGMYPMPMISHSPDFPFSLLPKPYELFLTKIFQFSLWIRRGITGKHGWICSESMGQAFLVAFQKSADKNVDT